MNLKHISIATVGISLALSVPAFASPEHCQPAMGLVDKTYTALYNICAFGTDEDIRLFWGEKGKNYGSFNALNKALAKDKTTLKFGMNAGMYHTDRSPVGLYIDENGTKTKLQTGASHGNFGLVPNGVFYRDGEGYGVMETLAYQSAGLSPNFATQSGPMLVIDGKLHPNFRKESTSKHIRNGVAVHPNGKTVYFVKSEVPMNFYDFATIFKDELKVENALYLDGVISRMFDAESGRNDIGASMGPIIGVVQPKPHTIPAHTISAASHQAHAHYIANAGVMAESSQTKILFDPFQSSGFGVYQEPLDEDIEALMAGEGDFADIAAVFVSHAHSDHFSAPQMIAYMTAQPEVHMVAPIQALEMMQKDESWDEALEARMTLIDLEYGDAPQTIKLPGIEATAVRIAHAGWPAPRRITVQNMVYRVTLDDDVTVMHMGDADPRPQHYHPFVEHWQKTRTDTAFPPYWFMLGRVGPAILDYYLNVETAIGVHVPLEIPQDLKATEKDYFSIHGETRPIGQEHTHDQ